MIKEKLGNTDNLVKKYDIDGPIANIRQKLENFDPNEEIKSKTDMLEGVDSKAFYAQLTQNFDQSHEHYKTSVKLINEIKDLHSKIHVKIYNLANTLSKISSVQKNIEKVNEMVMGENPNSVSISESYDVLKMSFYTWSENQKIKGKGVSDFLLPHFEKYYSSANDMKNVLSFFT